MSCPKTLHVHTCLCQPIQRRISCLKHMVGSGQSGSRVLCSSHVFKTASSVNCALCGPRTHVVPKHVCGFVIAVQCQRMSASLGKP